MTQPFLPNEADAFNANQAEPDTVDFEILLLGHQRTGVISGCAVTESSPAAQTVDVAAGTALLAGVETTVSAQADQAVSAADGSNPRIDLITVNSSGTVVVTAGTPASQPVAPAIPASSVPLAFLYVAASDNTHADNQINDKRIVLPDRPQTTYTMVLDGATTRAYDENGREVSSDTDSSVVIRAVIATNREIVFGPGTFSLDTLAASTDVLDLASLNNITIRGAGIGVTILQVGIVSWRSIIRGDQTDFIRIQDLTLDGNKASFAGSPGIGLRFLSSAADHLYFHRLEVINTDDRAASITAKQMWVTECSIHNCDAGLQFNTGNADAHVWVINNQINNIGTEWTDIKDGIFFGGQYLTAIGNTIHACTDTGINIGGTSAPTGWARVIGNLIYNIGNSGVNTGGGSNQIIANNTIFACGRKDAVPRSNAGIRIRDDSGGTITSDSVIIEGNRIYEDQTAFPLDAGALGQDDGIEIVQASTGGIPDNIIITGNDLRGNDVNAIDIVDQPDTLTIRNNLGYPDNIAKEVSTATTLEMDDPPIHNVDTSGGAVVITLLDNAVAIGKSFLIRRDGANTVTIDRAGSDTFDDADVQKTLDSDSAAIGIFSIGDTEWKIVATEGTVGGS